MKTLLGKTVCFLLGSHKWRRLRKSEPIIMRIADPTVPVRICNRCHAVRAVKTRKAA